ncbi:hypothetical protein BDF20DRAFT_814609 [Mycotypha africana]|uniref:uncharacterized protein n=1 Tax=Mycotypha africana TaxID=64632 RepID=UPI0023003190|nr:uncharacterized protein BDF20DRAFT_814609 [Mycotypha africana]KAI8988636.1 hypothetical protein BDF20DRAFT_814609 [Mycotypha africana]
MRIYPPPTIWSRFIDRHGKSGQLMLLAAGFTGECIIMFIILVTLGVFHNKRYQDRLGVPTSIGKTNSSGTSSGSWEKNDIQGAGDGTYYDPGVGYTACGTLYTAQDNIVAMNEHDFGDKGDNPNESSVCGACIIVIGPEGSIKAHIQDICPAIGCGRGSLDLTPAVFNSIGDLTQGRIPISWKHC